MSKNIAETASADQNVHVIADKNRENVKKYEQNNVKVHRCWTKGWIFPLNILLTINKIDDLDAVHIHHEYDGMYGGVLTNALFPLLLIGLQFTGGKVITQPHGILFDADLINTKSASSMVTRLPDKVLEFVFLCFNQLLLTLSDTLVVPNSVLKEELLDRCFASSGSITVIPHGVEPTLVDGHLDPPEDGLTLLYFGYITWRKGPDLLVEAADSVPDDWDIVLAGGKVPYLSDDPDYDRYYDEIRDRAEESENLTLTGFVDEDELDTYFSEADILVLPYRNFVAASGVFSLALRYSLPFLVSTELVPLLENPDIATLMEKHDVNESDLSVSIQNIEVELEAKARRLSEDPERYVTASRLSWDICRARNWEELRADYRNLYL